MQRKEFKAANERLLDALKRLAPNAYWDAEEVCRQADHHGEFIGYLCQLHGRIVERGFLGLEKARWIFFRTYSWSWDGTFDEAWLTEAIAKGEDRGMWPLSNPNWMWSDQRDGPWRRRCIEQKQVGASVLNILHQIGWLMAAPVMLVGFLGVITIVGCLLPIWLPIWLLIRPHLKKREAARVRREAEQDAERAIDRVKRLVQERHLVLRVVTVGSPP